MSHDRRGRDVRACGGKGMKAKGQAGEALPAWEDGVGQRVDREVFSEW